MRASAPNFVRQRFKSTFAQSGAELLPVVEQSLHGVVQRRRGALDLTKQNSPESQEIKHGNRF